MPFETVEEALESHSNLKKYSAKARRGWLSAFNNALDSGKDESSSFAIAYSVANNVDGKKNINDKKKSAAVMTFSSVSDALQHLSDYTNSRVLVAADAFGDLDIAAFIDDVEVMEKFPIDDFIDDVEKMSEAAKKESEARMTMDNPTQADLLMSALLQFVSNRTEEYRMDLRNMEDINKISRAFKKDLEDSVEKYQQGVQDVLSQQEEAVSMQQSIVT